MGKLVFEAIEWGIDPATQKKFSSVKEIETHICTEEELNVMEESSDDSAFFRT